MKDVIAQTIGNVSTKPQDETLTQKGFIEEIDAIRQRARQHIEEGAVTSTYKGDRNAVISLLNDALATELVCVLRYRRHHFMATGIDAQVVAPEFLEHANEEQAHADALAARIVQLGGDPDPRLPLLRG